MKKIQRIKKSYLLDNKVFTTFKNMKTYAYFNTGVGNTKTGYEMWQDEIIKEYIFERQERRLLCRTIYDYEKINLEKWNNRQTKLFNDE